MSIPYTLGCTIGGEEEANKTRDAPASLAIWTILLDVLPLTMLSSTINTVLPLNSSDIVFNFFLTESLRIFCPGMMNVLPMYRFLTNPSLYGTPSALDNPRAAILPLSGTGITASIRWSGNNDSILLARASPILNLAWCTEIPSITESGLAKYTCSKTHGV